jgi:hypothetical protein
LASFLPSSFSSSYFPFAFLSEEFITEGERRGNATIQKLRKENYNSIHDNNEEETKNEIQHSENNTNNIYFIEKILWAKGLARMIDLQEYYKQCKGQFPH